MTPEQSESSAFYRHRSSRINASRFPAASHANLSQPSSGFNINDPYKPYVHDIIGQTTREAEADKINGIMNEGHGILKFKFAKSPTNEKSNTSRFRSNNSRKQGNGIRIL